MAEQPSVNVDAEPLSMRATLSRRRLIMVVVGIMLAMLLSAIDQTVVGTAMPRIIADLNGLEHYAWVFTGYMLASTVSLPIYGKLSDIYGRRPFYLAGMVLFMAGSALAGTSQNMTQLILYRGLQGLGAGAMMPIAQAIIGDIFPPVERGKWQGLMMSVFGLATIVGPTLGGWITDNWGWRWVFYVNMPVGALALLTVALTLPGQGARRQHEVDYLGAATLTAATVPLLLGFTWAGNEYDWVSPQIIGLFAFSLLSFVGFYLAERRAAEPIINPSLFNNRIFTVSVLASFMLSVGMFGAIMYLPLFMQGVIGDSATSSGAVLTPMMLAFMASSIIGGQLMSRTGRYKALALGGFAMGLVGMVLLTRMDATATDALVVRNMIVTGLGIGVMMSLFTIVVQNAFPLRRLGEVTASLQFFRSIGGTVGVAVLGTIMTNGFHNAFEADLPATLRQLIPADKLALLANPQVLLSDQTTAQLQQGFAAFGSQGQALLQQLMAVTRTSLATAITDVFTVGAVVMALALVMTIFLPEIPLRGRHDPVPTPEAEANAGSPPRRVTTEPASTDAS
ncbi:MAG: MDR family MFS transporter [Dehalococcoidales bacterium]|nr:MDR family MFS transporter [Dehalococcoidales bacterium]